MYKPIKFFIRPLDEKVFRANVNRFRADKRIEMVPHDRPNFDFISFTEFANVIHFDYYSMEMVKKSDKSSYLEIYKREIQSPFNEEIRYSFLIEFGINFSEIRVFVKNHMNAFEYDYKGDYYCIKLTNKYQSGQFQFQIFQNFIQPHTTIYETAKYFTGKIHKCPYCVKFYFAQIINRNLKDRNELKQYNTIENLLNLCPGYIRINYSNANKKYFNTISIIFPWTLDLLNQIHYLELDGSFRAMRPYSFCIAQGIVYNESIPLAISIAPTESTILYSNIFDHIQLISLIPVQFSGKIVLSDMGSSIKSICNTYNFTQYFCHRHIIEHFGGSCVLGILCRRILKTYSSIEYDQKCIEIKEILNQYKEERIKQKTFTKEFESKAKDLEVMLSGDQGNIESNFFYIRWALWIRCYDHAGSCSNHNESLHAYINKDLYKCNTLESKLRNLISKTVKHCSNLKYRKGCSIKRKLNTLIRFLLQKLKNPTFDITNCLDENCQCGEKLFNTQVYGAEIPCLNQILLNAKEIILQIKNILEENKENTTINDLVWRILINKNILKPLRDDLQLEELYNSTFLSMHDLNRLPLTKTQLIILIKQIKSCFHFNFPEIPEIQNMWSHREVISTFSQTDTGNNTNNNDNNSCFVFSDEMEDEEVFFSRFQIDDPYFRKKIIMETVKEIIKVYPKINIHQSYEICFDKFEQYFDQSKLTVEKLIAKYKISCWKAADKLMDTNNFFK